MKRCSLRARTRSLLFIPKHLFFFFSFTGTKSNPVSFFNQEDDLTEDELAGWFTVTGNNILRRAIFYLLPKRRSLIVRYLLEGPERHTNVIKPNLDEILSSLSDICERAERLCLLMTLCCHITEACRNVCTAIVFSTTWAEEELARSLKEQSVCSLHQFTGIIKTKPSSRVCLLIWGDQDSWFATCLWSFLSHWPN